MPEVDVTLCKDCRFCELNKAGAVLVCTYKSEIYGMRAVQPDDYCSHAERKGDHELC